MKRLILSMVWIISLLLAAAPLHAQNSSSIDILTLETASPLMDAWAQAFATANPDITVNVTSAASDADILAGAGDADVIIYSSFRTEEPLITFECGFVSDAYAVLPDLGARYLADNSCGGSMDPGDAAAKAFVMFATSPDGQQIAIDQGLLPASVEVTDQAGMTVSVPQPVRRIASPYSMATYYVYTLGAGNRLVVAGYLGARDDAGKEIMRRIDPNFDVVSTAVSTLNQQEANIEELAALQPDLLLASARTDWLDAADELGLPIIRFEGESPDLLKEAMTMLGAVLGPDAAYRAERFNAYYDETLATILGQTQELEPKIRVYMSGTEPLRTASGDMYQSAMIEAAGGESVGADLTGYWNDVNLEQVLVWDPDVIFYPPYGGASAEAFTDSEEWAALRAVQEKSIYGVPKLAAPWDTPVPDSILGIIWMAQTLYPEQVTLDCAGEAINFFSLFYDYTMTPEEAAQICQ